MPKKPMSRFLFVFEDIREHYTPKSQQEKSRIKYPLNGRSFRTDHNKGHRIFPFGQLHWILVKSCKQSQPTTNSPSSNPTILNCLDPSQFFKHCGSSSVKDNTNS